MFFALASENTNLTLNVFQSKMYALMYTFDYFLIFRQSPIEQHNSYQSRTENWWWYPWQPSLWQQYLQRLFYASATYPWRNVVTAIRKSYWNWKGGSYGTGFSQVRFLLFSFETIQTETIRGIQRHVKRWWLPVQPFLHCICMGSLKKWKNLLLLCFMDKYLLGLFFLYTLFIELTAVK